MMSDCTAVANKGGGLLVCDLLMLELPHMTEREREFVAWEFTGFPCFFAPRDGEWWFDVFRRQLREFRTEPPRDP